jgi:hypothetical protein
VQIASAPDTGAYEISMKFGPAHAVLNDNVTTPLVVSGDTEGKGVGEIVQQALDPVPEIVALPEL